MIIDVINAALGIVKTSVIATILQIASRYYVVFLLFMQIYNCKDSSQYVQPWNVVVMFTAWSVAEIIRYGYYLHKDSKIIKFFRYNAFIINYPIGVLIGELITIWNYYKASNYTSYHCILIMLVYIPCFPYLYIHMLRQRRKNLCNKNVQQKNKKLE